MGLGKTLQVLVVLWALYRVEELEALEAADAAVAYHYGLSHRDYRQRTAIVTSSLIVAPKSVIGSWGREFTRHLRDTVRDASPSSRFGVEVLASVRSARARARGVGRAGGARKG